MPAAGLGSNDTDPSFPDTPAQPLPPSTPGRGRRDTSPRAPQAGPRLPDGRTRAPAGNGIGGIAGEGGPAADPRSRGMEQSADDPSVAGPPARAHPGNAPRPVAMRTYGSASVCREPCANPCGNAGAGPFPAPRGHGPARARAPAGPGGRVGQAANQRDAPVRERTTPRRPGGRRTGSPGAGASRAAGAAVHPDQSPPDAGGSGAST